jgi:hypothetical protein
VAQGTGWVQMWQSGKNGNDTWFTLVGFESDVNRTVQLGASIVAQMEAACKLWWDDFRPTYYGNNGRTVRREFKNAFTRVVQNRLKQMLAQTITEAGTGSELAVVERSDQVVKHMQDVYGWVPKGRASRRRSFNGEARSAGASAGRKATFHKGALGS